MNDDFDSEELFEGKVEISSLERGSSFGLDDRSCARIDVFAEPLDGLHCRIPLYSGWDCDAHWSHALRAMLIVEGIHYVDQHWAAEQGDGDGVETA